MYDLQLVWRRLEKLNLYWIVIWFYDACSRWLLVVVVVLLTQPFDDWFTTKQTYGWVVEFIITFNKYDEYATTVKWSV
jgi:hypothetical protein